MSAEELVGCLLVIRDALIVHQHEESIQSDDPTALETPIRIRMSDLLAHGYSKDDALQVVRWEYPVWLRHDMFERQRGKAW